MTILQRDFRTVPVPPEPDPVGIYQPAIDDSPPVAAADPVTHFEVERRIYGYLIRKIEHLPRRVSMAQGVAWLAALALAAQGVSALARFKTLSEVDVISAGIAVSSALGAWVLLYVATRGYLCHVEVDLRSGSLREIIYHRTGTTSLLRDIPFASVVALRSVPRGEGRAGASGDSSLVCQYRSEDGIAEMEIASGSHELVAALGVLMRDHLRAVPEKAMVPVDPVAELLLVQRATSIT